MAQHKAPRTDSNLKVVFQTASAVIAAVVGVNPYDAALSGGALHDKFFKTKSL